MDTVRQALVMLREQCVTVTSPGTGSVVADE
jgi:hypothetical protein